MKHAYLIIAHNEFWLLQQLIQVLDDSRNDIFIHFDKKLAAYPTLSTQHAGLSIIEQRIDVRWGDVSVVEAEYALFEAAIRQGKYAYYHLLSGVDLPLRSQDDIHRFFEHHQGKEFIGFSQYDYQSEVDRKVCRYHLYPRDFRPTNQPISIAKKIIRALFMRVQYLLHLQRNKHIVFKKGTQWISITDEFVRYIVSQKEEVLRMYQNTFCSDEIFAQTLCWNSKFRDKVFNVSDEALGCMRKIGWKNGQLINWTDTDYEELINAEMIFARKFTETNKQLIDKILCKIKQ